MFAVAVAKNNEESIDDDVMNLGLWIEDQIYSCYGNKKISVTKIHRSHINETSIEDNLMKLGMWVQGIRDIMFN